MNDTEDETLIYEDGVLVFTGKLEDIEDVVLMIQKDREDRIREVAGTPASILPPPNPSA
jgi:hypothetical protein